MQPAFHRASVARYADSMVRRTKRAAEVRVGHPLERNLAGWQAPQPDPAQRLTDSLVHIWGPPSATESLRTRLTRYLSPPLFPVRIRDLGARVELHDAPADPWRIGDLQVRAAQTIHPGPTLGYRLASSSGASVAYLPDHEPFLGGMDAGPAWISGHDLASGVDVLIHDAQYTSDEYDARIGWGHSSVGHAVAFADLAAASLLTLFHHDPTHDDEVIDRLASDAAAARRVGDALGAREGMVLEL